MPESPPPVPTATADPSDDVLRSRVRASAKAERRKERGTEQSAYPGRTWFTIAEVTLTASILCALGGWAIAIVRSISHEERSIESQPLLMTIGMVMAAFGLTSLAAGVARRLRLRQ